MVQADRQQGEKTRKRNALEPLGRVAFYLILAASLTANFGQAEIHKKYRIWAAEDKADAVVAASIKAKTEAAMKLASAKLTLRKNQQGDIMVLLDGTPWGVFYGVCRPEVQS